VIRHSTFLVTGSASGIGRNLADALVRGGARVIATDLDEASLREHAHAESWPRDRVLTHRLDVSQPEHWDAVVRTGFETFGSIDVLINVAGYLRPGWVHRLDLRDVHLHIDVNFKGVVFGTRAVAAGMVERKRGHIINVASLAALAPVPGIAVYSATKYAVRGFSLAAAQELRPHGVKVTVICPDAVRTPMLELQRDYEEAAMTFSGPRVLEASEVTDAILGRVLRHAPLEVFLPASRGWLARVADTFPSTAFTLGPLLRRRGRKRQQSMK
jgi:3-oxoacyl-[acyl-carrier protein] reductase